MPQIAKTGNSSSQRTVDVVTTPPAWSFARSDVLAVGLITVLALAVRVYHLTSRSLSLDDGFSIFLTQTDWASFRHWLWTSELNMAPYYLLLRFWSHAGSSDFTLRLLSVLLATATVPLIFMLGLRLFGRGTGTIAALLFSLQPFDVMLSQQVRSYALLILLVTVSALLFLRLAADRSINNSVAYAVVSAAAIYSHFFSTLVIFAQWLSEAGVRRDRKWKPLLLALGLLALLLVPLGLYLMHAPRSGLGWVPKVNGRQALEVLYSLTLSKARCLVYLSMWLVALICALRLSGDEARPYRFVAAWLLVPVAVAAGLSWFQSAWVPRFFAICLPASVLLASAGITQLARWSRLATTAVVLLALFYSASAIRSYNRHANLSIDWRTAMLYLISHAQPGDEVVMDPYVGFVFDHYGQLALSGKPPFLLASSLTAALPQPLPQNVWALAPVWVNVDDPASGPQQIEAQAKAFLTSHSEYCATPPWPPRGSVEVWQFRLCHATSGLTSGR